MLDRSDGRGRSLYDFGAIADEYDRWYETPLGQAHDRIQKGDVRRLLPRAARGDTLLDIGCGTGHWTSFFAQMGYRVTGLDVSLRMVGVARIAAPGRPFLVSDAMSLPFRRASFDVIAGMATLEFLPDPTLAVDEMVRCAKRHGVLLIGTLNRLAPLNRRRVLQGQGPYAWARTFTPEGLEAVLGSRGRVRMMASSLPSDEREVVAAGAVQDGTSSPRHGLAGPFLVASVRL